MAPTDPGCTIDLGMRAAGNLFLVQAGQSCHCTLSTEPIEQPIRKVNVSLIFKTASRAAGRNGPQRSHALESRRDANH